jgi:hypothetical protein
LAAGFHPEVEQSRQRCRQSSRSPGLDSLIEPVRNRLPSAALVAGAPFIRSFAFVFGRIGADFLPCVDNREK